MYSWHILVVLLVCIISACYAEPNKPQLPKQFQTPIQMNVTAKGILTPYVGKMFYDEISKQEKLILTAFTAFVQYNTTVVQIFNTTNMTQILNGQCYTNFPGTKFQNQFGWVQSSLTTYGGQVVVAGNKIATVWNFKFKGIILSLQVVDNNPYLLHEVISNNKGEVVLIVDLLYEELSALKGINETFKIPEYCFEDLFCPVKPPAPQVQDLQVVRFHSEEYFGLDNKNVADFKGDTVFLCITLVGDVHQYDTLVSVFNLKVNASFGQYGFCNNDNCIGGNQYSVGKEASNAAGVLGGQCSPNERVGNWYSLDSAAHCPEERPVGYKGCAWHIVNRTKTITAKCLESHGFIQQCKDDKFAPFPTAMNTLKKALEFDTVALGGCPPIAHTPPAKKRRVSTSTTTERRPSLLEQIYHSEELVNNSVGVELRSFASLIATLK